MQLHEVIDCLPMGGDLFGTCVVIAFELTTQRFNRAKSQKVLKWSNRTNLYGRK